MKYIRTKDGHILDIEALINQEKENPYYSDHEFEEIKNEDDCCVLNWTAIGTELNTIEDQVGKRLNYGMTITSPFIAQADTVEELCDEFVIVGKKKHKVKGITKVIYSINQLKNNEIYGAIWTKGAHDEPVLKSVAKLNEKGELELL